MVEGQLPYNSDRFCRAGAKPRPPLFEEDERDIQKLDYLLRVWYSHHRAQVLQVAPPSPLRDQAIVFGIGGCSALLLHHYLVYILGRCGRQALVQSIPRINVWAVCTTPQRQAPSFALHFTGAA